MDQKVQVKRRSLLHAIAEVQALGGTAAFIDAEHALDPAYSQKLGVNIDELLLVPTRYRRTRT